MFEAGDRIPSVPIRLVEGSGTIETTSDVVLGEGLVVLFSVPGAFTPTCHVNHLPGFLANAGKLKAAGVSRIVCVAANDHHVLKAWAEASGAFDAVSFIADPHAALGTAMGISKQFGDLGLRWARSAMIIRDGIAEAVFIEDKPGVSASGAPAILMALEAVAV